ncbi:hypothetical protein CWI39_1757p0010 [Hamiltosporidium magnivora]|uniref:Uncharacterized protein n=1 Tax=Hamiltosporidium magnivora TaxID=148818 RepID=A0A4Q9KYW4_9MICR|nr:hypothetical protein CWI39_1757p0010 [Hamiltosporidium magnivora]
MLELFIEPHLLVKVDNMCLQKEDLMTTFKNTKDMLLKRCELFESAELKGCSFEIYIRNRMLADFLMELFVFLLLPLIS